MASAPIGLGRPAGLSADSSRRRARGGKHVPGPACDGVPSGRDHRGGPRCRPATPSCSARLARLRRRPRRRSRASSTGSRSRRARRRGARARARRAAAALRGGGRLPARRAGRPGSGAARRPGDGAPLRAQHAARLHALREALLPPARRGRAQARRALRLQLPVALAAHRAGLLRRAAGARPRPRCDIDYRELPSERPPRLARDPQQRARSRTPRLRLHGRHAAPRLAARDDRLGRARRPRLGSWFVLCREDPIGA